MAEPTSTLTFGDLLIEVARKIGVAYYGAAGDEAAQAPIDPHDLAECKRHVNNGIRMFIADAPPTGWRWTRPVAQLVLWPSVSELAGRTVTGGAFAAGVTTITANQAVFHPSMELKTISIDGVGDFVISSYTSSTVVVVTGDASTAAADLFSITADGNYTLPQTFGGQYTGAITYAAGTNRGVPVSWSNDGDIRAWRENQEDNTGQPWLAAVRTMNTGSPRRRWELMAYPQPDEEITVEFPYDLHFDELTTTTEVHPAPYGHDETIKAACLAAAEKDVEGVAGVDWNYYQQKCLPNSYKIDARSGPRRLGYFGDPGNGVEGSAIRTFRDSVYQRPEVTFTP